jgi:hypothetical protein
MVFTVKLRNVNKVKTDKWSPVLCNRKERCTRKLSSKLHANTCLRVLGTKVTVKKKSHFCFCFFFVLVGMEPRTSHMVGKCPAAELCPSPITSFVVKKEHSLEGPFGLLQVR